MKLYGTINMDIVGSRHVKDRQRLQEFLSSCIDTVNKKYPHILVAPITITLGDEWQMVTDRPSESYNLVHEFQQLLWKENIEAYAGIGIGELSTDIYDDIRKMDGPCFHTAREALGVVKNLDKLKGRYSINKLNRVFLMTSILAENIGGNVLDFYYSSKGDYACSAMQEIAAASEDRDKFGYKSVMMDSLLIERTINLLIENNEILKAKMTDKQKKVYISYSKLGSYRKVMEWDGSETIGGISQKLNNASYFTIQRNHHMVCLLLDAYCSMGV